MVYLSPNRRWISLGGLILTLVLALAAAGQSVPAESPTVPNDVETGFLQNQGAQPRFQSASKLSPDVLAALPIRRVSTVPYFLGSFGAEGKTFPFSVVGSPPRNGGTTRIATELIPVSLLFEGVLDKDGEPILLDPGPVMGFVQGSPNFKPYPYQTGLTQFADAVQRAQFFRTMNQGWHTLLDPPIMMKPVTIDVPAGMAKVYRSRLTGVTYAVVDTRFFLSQLNTVVQLEALRPDVLALVLTSNVFLSPQADAQQCCLLGFHTSFVTGQTTLGPKIQTLVWASWVDEGIFAGNIADVTVLSHEISEWMNNPFGTNTVPAWQPLGAAGGCQNNLETADPVAALPNAGYPVNIDGFIFHPQTEVLLPWFTRQGTSDSIDGALSFPDETLVTKPSSPCTGP